MTNVSDMVNNFLQAEEKNFSLFNFVNELNRYVLERRSISNSVGFSTLIDLSSQT